MCAVPQYTRTIQKTFNLPARKPPAASASCVEPDSRAKAPYTYIEYWKIFANAFRTDEFSAASRCAFVAGSRAHTCFVMMMAMVIGSANGVTAAAEGDGNTFRPPFKCFRGP